MRSKSHDDAAIRRVVLLGMGGFFAVALAVLAVLLRVYRDPAAATDAGSARPGPVREIAITAGEFTFEPASVDVAPGETVRFVVTNTGAIEHEFRLSTQHAIDAHLAAGHATDDHDTGMQGDDAPDPILIAPGETATFEWTFGDGADVPDRIACLVPGHYEAGMKGVVEIAR